MFTALSPNIAYVLGSASMQAWPEVELVVHLLYLFAEYISQLGKTQEAEQYHVLLKRMLAQHVVDCEHYAVKAEVHEGTHMRTCLLCLRCFSAGFL